MRSHRDMETQRRKSMLKACSHTFYLLSLCLCDSVANLFE